MKTLLALALLLTSASAFASELDCKVIHNETIYSGHYSVTVTNRGIAIRKQGKLIASGPAEDGDRSSAAYELKRNEQMIEEGGEVFMSNTWEDSKGGEFTIIDRTRDLGNVSTEFSCVAK